VTESPEAVDVEIRRGDRKDLPFMRSLLGFAYNWHLARFDTEVSISRYLNGWGREGDVAYVATDGGHPVGAGWYRLFEDDLHGYGFVDDETPELTVVVVPTRQGQGIGPRLLTALLERAKFERHPGLSVSVQRGHSDTANYLEVGFEQVAEEGDTLTLLKSL
jgi:GNAT superfamily N-acetyltransferase